jgi:phospho-N-acetylmuramoyl-pentapeptide-transferase
MIAVIWGRPLINFLRRNGIGKQIRIEQPGSHQVKTGTPTMGGILFVVPVLLVTGVLNIINLAMEAVGLGMEAIGQSTLFLFFCLGTHALLGAVDDWQGVKGLRGKGQGMSARMKSSFQLIFATVIALVLYFGPPQWDYVGVPGFPDFFRIGPLIIPVTIFLLVWMSNAVNLTDGLDSLAGSTSTIAFACYGTIAYMQNQVYLAAFCFTLVGALMGFLWYNAYPAQLIMGDLGSLALGATLALVAVMTGQWLLLPVIGLVFAAETHQRDAASQLFQVDPPALWRRAAHLQDSAAAPPLRVARLERNAGEGALLAGVGAGGHVGCSVSADLKLFHRPCGYKPHGRRAFA